MIIFLCSLSCRKVVGSEQNHKNKDAIKCWPYESDGYKNKGCPLKTSPNITHFLIFLDQSLIFLPIILIS